MLIILNNGIKAKKWKANHYICKQKVLITRSAQKIATKFRLLNI